jgi:solute carrier family 25 phosphate transporter 23/24/25/41
VIAKMWVEECPIDCGTDIAVPATSSDVPWWYCILGGIGGVMSRTLTAPLEKIKLQAQTSGKFFSPLAVARELGATHQKLGVRGLFAGNMTNCLRVFPYAGIVTVVYLNALTFTPADNELDPMEPFYRSGCAALAGIVGQLATYPIDVVRALMTVNSTKHRAVLGTFKSVVRDAGPRGLYKGLAPTLFAVMPFLACQMSTADALKSVCASRDFEVTTFRMGLIGGTAGIVAQSVVYPLDVLRRRMQMNAAGGGNVNVISDSTWLAMRQVVKREGVRSLFAGVVPTYMKVFPAVAIAMTTTKELIGYSKRNWE